MHAAQLAEDSHVDVDGVHFLIKVFVPGSFQMQLVRPACRRVPSECLPISMGGRLAEESEPRQQAEIWISRNAVVLRLKRRKNKPQGSRFRASIYIVFSNVVRHVWRRLVRTCWCHKCKLTCPVHVLGRWLRRGLACGVWGVCCIANRRTVPVGDKPFSVRPASALADMRALLAEAKVKNAWEYRTHDLRRGHAQDLVEAGGTLAEVLRAGEWRSAAFANYIDQEMVEANAVLESHFSDSDSDSDECM